jgi:hypothetical protein
MVSLNVILLETKDGDALQMFAVTCFRHRDGLQGG